MARKLFLLFGFAMSVTILLTFLMILSRSKSYDKITAADSLITSHSINDLEEMSPDCKCEEHESEDEEREGEDEEREGKDEESHENVQVTKQEEVNHNVQVIKRDEDAQLTVDAEIKVPELQYQSIENEKFTVIIPTYKRVELLKRVLENYCKLTSHIDSIIVVWNNIEEPIPDTLKYFSCSVPVHLKQETTNSLNNRFKPFPEIRTEAVLSADDDLIISHEDLIFQFETWKQFKHLIVGYAPRRHIEDPHNSGKFVYVKKLTAKDRRYSFILTTSAMFHAKYLELYQSQLTDEFRNFIDETMNCEDLVLNAIVADYLKVSDSRPCPGLLIEEKHIRLIETENKGYDGLWHRKGHQSVREKCLSMLAKQYNGLPFGYSTLKIVLA